MAIIVHNGSKVMELQALTLSIFRVCASSGISFEMKWIPRDLNYEADFLSKIIDFDDYSIKTTWLIVGGGHIQWIGLRVVITPNVPVLILHFFQPYAEAVDTFTQNWEWENNWVHPPVSQIGKVITHMAVCKAEGTLVIPMWKSSYFSVLLCEDGKHWNTFLEDWRLLPNITHLFIRGKAKNNLFASKQNLPFRVVALRMNFKITRNQCSLGFCTDDCDACSQYYK